MNEEKIGVAEEPLNEGAAEGLAEPQSEEPVAGEPEQESPSGDNQEIPNEVWKAARLRAEKEAEAKAQGRIDDFYAQMYRDYGIKTEEDYKKYMAQQETDARNARLENAGISSEDIMAAVNSLPEMETVRRIAAAQQQKFQAEALDYAVKAISEIDPDIKSLNDLKNSPTHDKFEELVNRGYSLPDAYLIANHKKLVEKGAAAAQQETIKKISQNGAASPGSLTGTPETQKVDYDKLPPEEFEKYVQKAMRGELSHN